MQLRYVAGVILVLALLAAHSAAAQESPTPLPSIELPPALARVLTDYETAWSAGDAAGLARLFAEDGFVLSRSRPPIRGRAAIEKHYTGKGGPLSLRALAYAAEGSVGFIIGAYAHKKGAPDAGKFTLTLVKNDEGRWLIMSDMDSGNG